MDGSDDELRSHALTYVARDFGQRRDELRQGQQREHGRRRDIRLHEVRSFEANREEAEKRHWQSIKAIDSAELEAFKRLDAEQRSLKGRLTGLVKGRAHQERQREELAERFEAQRMAKHRELEQQKERQFEVEQKARLRYAQELKEMRERHSNDRAKQRDWEKQSRDRLAEERVTTVKNDRQQQAERELRRGLAELERDDGRSRAIGR